MRAIALSLLALAGAACTNNSDVGAVVVRWRIAEQASGQMIGCIVGVAPDTVSIDQVELDVEHLNGSVVDCGMGVGGCSFSFVCGPQEGTSSFSIPSGSYVFSVRAIHCCSHACSGADRQQVGYSPPPLVRNIRPGEITNLDAVEVLVPPCERPACGTSSNSACDAF